MSSDFRQEELSYGDRLPWKHIRFQAHGPSPFLSKSVKWARYLPLQSVQVRSNKETEPLAPLLADASPEKWKRMPLPLRAVGKPGEGCEVPSTESEALRFPF